MLLKSSLIQRVVKVANVVPSPVSDMFANSISNVPMLLVQLGAIEALLLLYSSLTA